MSPEKRDGIVALISDREVQESVAVEIRNDHGAWIIPNSKRRAGRLGKKSVGFAVGVDVPQ